MKRILLLLPVILLCKLAVAQDAKAKSILDAVALQTKSYSSIEIEFSYTMENKKSNLSEEQKAALLLENRRQLGQIAAGEKAKQAAAETTTKSTGNPVKK